MTEIDFTVASSSLCTEPKNVSHMGTVFVNFRYATAMNVGAVLRTKERFSFSSIPNRYFIFGLQKRAKKTVSIICHRIVKDETVEEDSSTEAVALEADEGCFLRLYISVIGVNENPKSASLRCSDTQTLVEFMEDSFLFPIVQTDYMYTVKCVFRRIETTILPNEKQELMWQTCMTKPCKLSKHKKNMAYVLNRKLENVLTGRKTKDDGSAKIRLIAAACHYHEELFAYFKAKADSKPVPKDINIAIILGYVASNEERAITEHECVTLWWVSQCEGLTFLKELCTAYMVENFNDELVVQALRAADLSADARLFKAAWLFCIKIKLRIFHSDSWKLLVRDQPNRARSIVHNFLLSCFTDDLGFPPSTEEETGEPTVNDF